MKSAVAQDGILHGVGRAGRVGIRRRAADSKSAIQQIENLRYEHQVHEERPVMHTLLDLGEVRVTSGLPKNLIETVTRGELIKGLI